MASAAISTNVAYNPPVVTTLCGLVYCSRMFEDLLIKCTKCTQEFDILSYSLFIKHIKKCLPTADSQPESASFEYPIENIFTSDIKSDIIDESADNTLDPLLSMKLEPEAFNSAEQQRFEEADYLSDDKDDLNLNTLDHRIMVDEIISEYKKHPLLWDANLQKTSTLADKTLNYRQILQNINAKFRANLTDPQLRRHISRLRCGYRRTLKQSGASSDCVKVEPTSETSDEGHELEVSDEDAVNERRKQYQLSDHDKILDIIDQYKKYSLLWDPSESMYKDAVERGMAFSEIARFINDRHKTKVTGKDISTKIECLRSAYKRAANRNRSLNHPIVLWYYDNLSFVFDEKPDQVETDFQISEEPPSTEEVTLGEFKIEPAFNQSADEAVNNQAFEQNQPVNSDSCEDDDSLDEEQGHDSTTKKIILSIITEYKKRPCLWDPTVTCRTSKRYNAMQSITNAINVKFKKKLSHTTIRRKLAQLRNCYWRVLRNKQTFEKHHPNAQFPVHLYYFNQISFIGTTNRYSRNSSDTHPKETTEDNRMSIDSDDDEDFTTFVDSKPKPCIGKVTQNKELLTCIIEEFKKYPCLWSSKEYKRDIFARRTAYAKMAKVVNNKFQTKFTSDHLSIEMRRVRSSYLRMLRNKRENPQSRSSMWYADILSFINSDDVEMQATADSDESDVDFEEDDSDSLAQKRRKTQSKKNVFAIIDLYKAEPILWDHNHAKFMLRSERTIAFENMRSILGTEYDCHLTPKELRYQLRYLKDSYYRSLQNDAAGKEGDITRTLPKPFFHDRLSFLPATAKNRSSTPKLQAITKTDPGEDITYLTENRPLMINFIKLYKEQGCLWDKTHKDMNDPTAQSDAYDRIIKMFSQNGVLLTKEQVASAIGLLYSAIASANDDSVKTKEPIWFCERLKFLVRVNRVPDIYCSHCSQHFHSVESYEKHKNEIAGDVPFKCIVCNIGFLTRSKYSYHRKKHQEPFKCDQCDFQAYDKNNFKVHMHRHNGIMPYQCETCDKGFVTTTELKRHVLNHTSEKPFICEICGQKFPANSKYLHHMKRHRNQRDHKCQVCGYVFYDAEGLRIHMVSHPNERKHSCNICGALFKLKSTLRQHKTLHDEVKKFACRICGKCFAQKSGLHYHMKSHRVVLENS